MAFGFFIDGPMMIIPFIIIVKYRIRIAEIFQKTQLPKFVAYLLSSLPFMIFEENINCGAFKCTGFTLLPFTIPFLLGFLVILGLAVEHFRIKDVNLVTIIFSTLGTLFEVFFGVSNVEFRALSILPFIFVFIWTSLSYAFFTFVPLTILMESNDSNHSTPSSKGAANK